VDTKTSHVVELRRYALHPGARETLIELFDRELVETQEDVGMRVLGQFRDLDDPDSFVWLRGFQDMESRKRGLEAFYGGPVWEEHMSAANATMIDSDNVLLLRPVSGLELDPRERAPRGSDAPLPGLLGVTIYPLAASGAEAFPAFFAEEVEPALADAGISVLATYATEHSENTFPALPVRHAEVFVWLAMFADDEELRTRVAEADRIFGSRQRVTEGLAQRLEGKVELLRLAPTERSLIHA
jgi:quinol monooxygenase YgiN